MNRWHLIIAHVVGWRGLLYMTNCLFFTEKIYFFIYLFVYLEVTSQKWRFILDTFIILLFSFKCNLYTTHYYVFTLPPSTHTSELLASHTYCKLCYSFRVDFTVNKLKLLQMLLLYNQFCYAVYTHLLASCHSGSGCLIADAILVWSVSLVWRKQAVAPLKCSCHVVNDVDEQW